MKSFTTEVEKDEDYKKAAKELKREYEAKSKMAESFIQLYK